MQTIIDLYKADSLAFVLICFTAFLIVRTILSNLVALVRGPKPERTWELKMDTEGSEGDDKDAKGYDPNAWADLTLKVIDKLAEQAGKNIADRVVERIQDRLPKLTIATSGPTAQAFPPAIPEPVASDPENASYVQV